MAVDKLTVVDFQSHKNTVINFNKGFNCVVGSTNSGKSSIIRALKYILCGEPWEKSFVRNGRDVAKLSIEMDGHKVERTKGEDANEYCLDGVPYKNFGVAVPGDVTNALRLNTIQIDDKSINLNFADQLDSLFLIDDSDTTKAKLLNKLSGLDKIDDAMKGLAEDKRECVNEIKILVKDNEETIEILKKYVDVDEKKKIVYDLDIMLGGFEKDNAKLIELYAIKENVAKWKAGKTEIRSIEAQIAAIETLDLEQTQEDLSELSSKYTETINTIAAISEVSRLEKEISSIESSLKKYELTSTDMIDKLERGLDELKSGADALTVVKDLYRSVRTERLGINETKEQLEAEDLSYKDNYSKYEKILRANNVCPTCGSAITDEIIDKCLQNL